MCIAGGMRPAWHTLYLEVHGKMSYRASLDICWKPHCESSEVFAPVESGIMLPFILLVAEFDLVEATALSISVSASSRHSVCFG